MASARHIDLAISIRVADVELQANGRPRWIPGTDEELLKVGGRWDRRRKKWSPHPAQRCLILRFHRGQEEAIRWFVAWLRCFVANDWTSMVRVWSALLIGGRRSGKTHVLCAVLIVFAVLHPKARIWAISPTLETGDELDEAFKEMLPRRWYVRRQAKTGRSTTYTLANGSRLLLKSGVKPARLKAGRVDLALMNEAQELTQKAYLKLRAAIADRGGLVLLAANPPDSPTGRWVEKHYYAAVAKEIQSIAFQLSPERNPWINFEALASMSGEADEKTYQRDVLGLFPPIGDVVLHAWSDENWKDPPLDLVDITAEVTRRKLGRAAGYVVGMDFQRMPAMVGIVLKIFKAPGGEDELLWVVDEVVVDEADEGELVDGLESTPRWQPGDRAPDKRAHDAGYRGWLEPDDPKGAPVHCACVIDASGFFQDGDHTQGRRSDQHLKARGWVYLYTPQHGSDRNPAISERMRTGNSLLKSHDGRRRLFVAKHCTATAEALRQYENKNGFPNRRSVYAHVVDGVTYPAYRFYGRPKIPKKEGETKRPAMLMLPRAAELRGL